MKPRFISDIHLSKDSPHLTNAFKTFLNESKESCTHLFILGDLFEIWIGDDDDNSFNQEIKKILIRLYFNGPSNISYTWQ
jgi:UDP-2,3-diacylglucosamine hydrolase